MVAVSTAQAHSGDQSLAVTARTSAWHGAQYDLLDVVTPGVSYRVTVWGRLASGSASLILTRELEGCSENEFVRLDEITGSSTAWTELSGTLLVPSSCTPTLLVLFVESSATTTSFFIDDVELERL